VAGVGAAAKGVCAVGFVLSGHPLDEFGALLDRLRCAGRFSAAP
jgi:hypothetical protein